MWTFILKKRKIRELKCQMNKAKEFSTTFEFKNISISFENDLKIPVKKQVFTILPTLKIPELMDVNPFYAWESGIMDCQFSWKLNTQNDELKNGDPVDIAITLKASVDYESLLYYIQNIQK